MTIYTKYYANGSEFSVDNCTVKKALGDINLSSNFIANVSNYKGGSSTLFNVGDEIEIKSDKDVNPPTTKLFLGLLENIELKGKEQTERMILSGRDYTARLIDRTVEPEAYNNLPAGSIVKDIIAKYSDDITVNNVSDGNVIERIVFNHKPVFDAVNQLAQSTGFTFHVDNDKDLHFEEKSTVSSNLTFGSGNITNTTFKDKRNEVYNEIWVYGDRYLDGYQEQFEADGTGSIFALEYKPSNTAINIGSGTTTTTQIQPGGVYQMTYGTGSDVKYLVDYDDRRIIFTSGTEQGDNIPKAGSQVTVDYMRDLPIVKVGENDASIAAYGRRVKVNQDKSIKDPITAELFMLRELEELSDPVKEGKISVQGINTITPGETCVVDIPIYGINNVTYDMLEAVHTFTKRTELSDNVLDIRLNKKIPDVTDTLKNITLQLKDIQGADMSDSDLLTRYKTSTGSMGIRQSGTKIWTRGIAGEGLIWGNSALGLFGVQKWVGSVVTSFVLGNAGAAILGTSTLGTNTGSWVLQWSGGYF